MQEEHKESERKLTREQKDRMKVIGVYCLVSLLFWLTYTQAFSSMAIFVHDYMDKMVGSIQIPDGIFLSTESFLLILLAPFLATLYPRLRKRKRDPSSTAKSAISLYSMAAAFLVMAIASSMIPYGAIKANISWGYTERSHHSGRFD